MILHLIRFIFSKKYRIKCTISNTMCECGKYNRCIRQLRVTNKGYFGIDTLYVRKQDHFRCGKVQKIIK